MFRIRQLLLILMMVCCVRMPVAHAQHSVSIVPRAISVQTFEEMMDELQLSREQHRAAARLHDAYAESYAEFWQNTVAESIDRLRRVDRQRIRDSTPNELGWYYDTIETFRKAARSLDDQLWLRLQALLTDRQMIPMQRVSANHALWRYGQMLHIHHPIHIDFVYPADIIPFLGALTEREEQALQPIVSGLESTMARHDDRLHDRARSLCIAISDIGWDTNHVLRTPPEIATLINELDVRWDDAIASNDRAARMIEAALLPPRDALFRVNYFRSMLNLRFQSVRARFGPPEYFMHQISSIPDLPDDVRAQVDATVQPIIDQYNAAVRRVLQHETTIRDDNTLVFHAFDSMSQAEGFAAWDAEIDEVVRLLESMERPLVNALTPLVLPVGARSQGYAEVKALLRNAARIQTYDRTQFRIPPRLHVNQKDRASPWSVAKFSVERPDWSLPEPLGNAEMDALADALQLNQTDRTLLHTIASSAAVRWRSRPTDSLDGPITTRDRDLLLMRDIDGDVFDQIRSFFGHGEGRRVIDRAARQRDRLIMIDGGLHRIWRNGLGYGNAAKVDLEIGINNLNLSERSRARLADVLEAYSVKLNHHYNVVDELRRSMMPSLTVDVGDPDTGAFDGDASPPIFLNPLDADPTSKAFHEQSGVMARFNYNAITTITAMLDGKDKHTFQRNALRAYWPGKYRDPYYAGGVLQKILAHPDLSESDRRSVAAYLESYETQYESAVAHSIAEVFRSIHDVNRAADEDLNALIGRSSDSEYAFEQMNHRALRFARHHTPD